MSVSVLSFLFSTQSPRCQTPTRLLVVNVCAGLDLLVLCPPGAAVPAIAELTRLVQERPAIMNNLVDAHRQSLAELVRGVPSSIGLESYVRGFVLLYAAGTRTVWHAQDAATRARLLEHVDATRRELWASTVADDSSARVLELSSEFEDGTSVYALHQGPNEIHVAFDVAAPVAMRDGLCATLLETMVRCVQSTHFAPVKK